MDFTLRIVSKDGGGFSGDFSLIVDVDASLLKGHTLPMKEQPDALFQGRKLGIFQGRFQFRLAAEYEGDSVFRIRAEADHGFQDQKR